MNSNMKPGGGNKPQPYVPKGHGDKSGEYANKASQSAPKQFDIRKGILNIPKKYNFMNSLLVGDVKKVYRCGAETNMPCKRKPSSVFKKIVNGYVVSERYYNDKGEVYMDIDYTCHGNPKQHPVVPHIHRWTKLPNGKFRREGWVKFL